MCPHHEYLVNVYTVVLNINHQWRNVSVYGKPDYQTQSGVSFIFPHPKDADSFTTASSWSLFSSVPQLTLE